jgi:hypothetical protein
VRFELIKMRKARASRFGGTVRDDPLMDPFVQNLGESLLSLFDRGGLIGDAAAHEAI